MPAKVTGVVARPSVTTKRTVTPSGARATEPAATIPPSRTARPSGTPSRFTSDGA